MINEVFFDADARAKLKAGINKVANAVKITMGPKGRAVLIERGTPMFTLDGVTVAESIEKLPDKVENMGAQLVKNVASKTNEHAGDGTTTATLLVQAILLEALKGIEQGLDPIAMKEAIEEYSQIVLEEVKAGAKEVKGLEEMKNIATISSRDPEAGEIIAKIYDKIGRDGVITTEETKTLGMDYEIVEGLQLESGMAHPYFMTNADRQQAVLENPYIVVASQNLTQNSDIVGVLNQIIETDSKSVVFIVDDAQGEAFTTILLNKLQGRMKTLVVKAPGYGDNKTEQMRDICAITKAEHISEELGSRLEHATLEDFGRADKVVAYKDRTIIVGGRGNAKAIKDRIKIIEAELEDADSSYKKKSLEQRLAKMKGGVAVIKVGEATEEATEEKQFRIEDAINSVKSAIEEGVVVGGGMALYKASERLKKALAETTDPDRRFGIQALYNAIRQPAWQILKNQGGENPDVTLAGDYKLPKEVIDPFKVERVALEQASSVVGLLLVTGAVVIATEEDNQKKNEKPNS